jgi:hypothetical protein
MKRYIFFVSLLFCSLGAMEYINMVDQYNQTAEHVITFQNPRPKGYLDSGFLSWIQRVFNIKVFVETGTGCGNSTRRAASLFENVHSIELYKPAYLKAREVLKNYKNVQLYLGDSIKILPYILRNQHEQILFWLDGHFCGTAKGDSNTPILDELKAIDESGVTTAAILIDDIRCFMKPSQDPTGSALEGYPDLKTIVLEIKKINSAYKCVLLADTLLAYLDNDNVSISPVARACTISRLCSDYTDISDILEYQEHIISTAKDAEKKCIQSLIGLVEKERISNLFGFGRYFYFWNGLTLHHDKKFVAAQDQFKKSIEHISDFRSRSYIIE